MRSAFQGPADLLLALQSVESVGGRLALEAAVETLVQSHQGAEVESHHPATLVTLQEACVELLQALPPSAIAGGGLHPVHPVLQPPALLLGNSLSGELCTDVPPPTRCLQAPRPC